MANTLPTDIAFQLIDETATIIRRSPESIQDVLDSFIDYDLAEVLEAMQALDTADVDTLTAYLASEAVLDDSLDSWLMEVA